MVQWGVVIYSEEQGVGSAVAEDSGAGRKYVCSWSRRAAQILDNPTESPLALSSWPIRVLNS